MDLLPTYRAIAQAIKKAKIVRKRTNLTTTQTGPPQCLKINPHGLALHTLRREKCSNSKVDNFPSNRNVCFHFTKQPKNFDEKKLQVLMRHFLDFKNTVALLNTLKA